MKIVETDLEGVVIVEPDIFGDHRGYFMEVYNRNRYEYQRYWIVNLFRTTYLTLAEEH